MNRSKYCNNRFVIACFALLLLAGCKAKTFKYVNENEIPPGPGVFSGEKGEWTIYDSKHKQQSTDEEKPAAETAKEEPEAGSAAADHEEFKQYQEWKQQQQEFQDFQEWKKSSQGTREYQEFQQWREWKEFKEWQNQQEKHD